MRRYLITIKKKKGKQSDGKIKDAIIPFPKKKKMKIIAKCSRWALVPYDLTACFFFKEERNKYVEKGRNDVSDLLGFHSFPYVEIFFLLVPTLES